MRTQLLLLLLSATAEVWTVDGGYQRTTRYDDGGTALQDAVVLDPSGAYCKCSTGSNCSVAGLDGGLVPAPVGATLHGATGSGCLSTPCVALWGQPSPFNPACACPLVTLDGGRGC